MATKAIENVTATSKANIYFDGNVMSHTLHTSGGAKITLGLIRAGSYHFDTDAPEEMEIVAGQCRVRLDGGGDFRQYGPGDVFQLPGKAGFEITVAQGVTEYICKFL